MIILDTSVLVAALTGEKALESELRETLREGTWIGLPTIVWYEWLRGPRLPEETAAAAVLFRPYETIPFQRPEAVVAARLYRTLSRPRGREMDFTIAACALVREAELWTLNQDDFTDIPQLRLSPR